MNTIIYPVLVVIGFVLGYVCCMFDVNRNIQQWKKEMKDNDHIEG